MPPEAETKPRRKDPGSRPRTLRSPTRSRHARGRDPRPVRRPRCPFSPQAAASERWLLAAAPGPTGAHLSSRQSRGSLNHGAPGRCRCRRFSPCSTLRIRLGSRSCSCRGAAAGTHTMQVHRAPPAARRLAPSGVGRQGPPPGQWGASRAERAGPRGTNGGWAGRCWDWAYRVPREDPTQELAGSRPPRRPSSMSTCSLLYRTRSSQAQNSGF